MGHIPAPRSPFAPPPRQTPATRIAANVRIGHKLIDAIYGWRGVRDGGGWLQRWYAESQLERLAEQLEATCDRIEQWQSEPEPPPPYEITVFDKYGDATRIYR